MRNLSILNHEDGEFHLVETREQAESVIKILIESGTDLENITIIEGMRVEIEQIPMMEYDYKIKDKATKLQPVLP